MNIIPAIDIKDGKLVRLERGNFNKDIEYSSDPLAVAIFWEEQGARIVHLVDLDAAKEGHFVNFDIIACIAKSLSIPVQYGGGIRTIDDMEKLFSEGVKRVVIGTGAVINRNFIENVLGKYSESIVLAADSLNGKVMIKGWQEDSGILIVDFIREIEAMGAKRVLITDISRDGMLIGPAIELYKEILRKTGIKIIVSGGISRISDLKKLAALKESRIESVIIGKAFYEKKIKFKDAVRSLSS